MLTFTNSNTFLLYWIYINYALYINLHQLNTAHNEVRIDFVHSSLSSVTMCYTTCHLPIVSSLYSKTAINHTNINIPIILLLMLQNTVSFLMLMLSELTLHCHVLIVTAECTALTYTLQLSRSQLWGPISSSLAMK